MERPKISHGYVYNPCTRTWSRLRLPVTVIATVYELRKWEFLIWQVEQGLIGGPNDGDDSAPWVLDRETAERLRRELTERLFND